MFNLIRLLLFKFKPETAHNILRKFLILNRYIPGLSLVIRFLYTYKSPRLEKKVFGLKFSNPIGLAAGFDKNGEIYNELANFGFGFIEIGSLTPKEQLGNPKPRVFRLPQEKAIINRMGLNNRGIKNAIENLKKRAPKILIAGNISKSNTTNLKDAAKDYEKAFASLYDYVDFFVINVSCPNVKDLTSLQDINALSEIIDRLTTLRKYLDDYRPILLKISPDLDIEHLDEIIDLIQISGLDGIVATNTTTSRENLITNQEIIKSIGSGGLSGTPLYNKSLNIIKYINKKSNGHLPIIGVGGIMSGEDAIAMLDAGASLVQIYSGFIYKGPGLIKRILKKIDSKG